MEEKSTHDLQTVRRKRMFVIDTNVLLHDSNALSTFLGVVVIIPFVVLEELDTFKKEGGSLGGSARQTIRGLDELRKKGSLHDGVEVELPTGKTFIQVMNTPTQTQGTDICSDTIDNQIILLVQNLVAQGNEVTLVTKDINARVKADALNLSTEDYVRESVNIDTFYKGWIRIPVSAHEMKSATPETVAQFAKDQTLFPNEFIALQSQHNEYNYRVFRFLGGNSFKEVRQPKTIGNLQARNVEQLMALDALLDDDIQLVSLIGPAGTGKTFLALLAGLFKVAQEKEYRRFLISRPIVALGADIGYLPGDVKEKLKNWMMPIHDNLEFIFSETSLSEGKGKDKKKEGKEAFAETAKERRKKKRHPEQGRSSDIDRLEQKGILSMEAITYMRGRSIPNQFVLIDEVQNLTPHEVKTIVSRAGEGTKIILCGDPHQIDSPFLDFSTNGLTVTSEKFKNESIYATVYLETTERSELSEKAAELL